MNENNYTIEERTFRTESDYKMALRDKEIIDKIRIESLNFSKDELQKLYLEIVDGKYRFRTILGDDFKEEIEERIKDNDHCSAYKKKSLINKGSKDNAAKNNKPQITISDSFINEEIARQEKRRKLILFVCALVAFISFGYLSVYNYYNYRTGSTYEKWSSLKEVANDESNNNEDDKVIIHYVDEEIETPDILDEYKNLYNKNKKLIGWLKIDDKKGNSLIDYPVMQTSDNEYYLDHNINQEYDKNGSIFLDCACDVIKGNTNYILYGHHMRNGQMFGNLDEYEDFDFYENHKIIQFDTIYEKGTYEVMYVFRSRVYSEEEIVFKYYQFIDVNGEAEFNSYMQEMAGMSLYETGVSAQYGDKLLTLSTCDYKEENGRFVVVAKRID